MSVLRFLAMAILPLAILPAATADVSGNWIGEIKPNQMTLRFAVRLAGGGGSWESVDQHATIPVKTIEVNGTLVKIDVGVATFEGTLDAAGTKIDGTFHQGGLSLPLTLRKVDHIDETRRPQDPVRPLPYAEEDVTYKGAADVALAGTLTYPKAGGPFATALLITGSGAQDRDEALLGHKPFLVLSDALTRHGFAVLRVDDRGMGKSGGVFENTSYEDKVADVLAGVAFLKTRQQVDPARIGVIGHSEGGIIGPLAAARTKDIAFVVMLAGAGVPGEQILRQQGIDLIRASGGSEAQVQTQVETQGKMFAIAKSEPNRAEAEKKLRAALGPLPGVEQQIKVVLSPTFRDLLAVDPAPTLRLLTCPVLALNGSKDLQVSAAQNLPAIAAALSAGASQNWAVVKLPGLNHLFQTAKTGAVSEYVQIDETIAPVALRAITDWLSRVMGN